MNVSSQIDKKFSPEILQIFQKSTQLAQELGIRAALVGGIVRDLILNKPLVDVDFMVDHPGEPLVKKLTQEFKGQMVSHERFLTFTITLPSHQRIDVVTAREETYPARAKLPVIKPATIEDDLKRRDFSINAIACWLTEPYGEILDPFNGLKDLKEGVIRVLHDKSFIDDPTRIFRAARFSGRLRFPLHPGTKNRLHQALKDDLPALLTPVRLRHEFELILKESHPWLALEHLQDWRALTFIHKDWTLLKDHKKILKTISPTSSNDFLERRLAGWFTPWGKSEAEKMMTDLAFERVVKKKVLSLLS